MSIGDGSPDVCPSGLPGLIDPVLLGPRPIELALGIDPLGLRRSRHFTALHIRPLLPHLDRNRRLAFAGRNGDLFDLAPLECYLARSGFFGGGVILAMRAAQKPEQFELLGAADRLIRPAELHAGLGELLEQLVYRDRKSTR